MRPLRLLVAGLLAASFLVATAGLASATASYDAYSVEGGDRSLVQGSLLLTDANATFSVQGGPHGIDFELTEGDAQGATDVVTIDPPAEQSLVVGQTYATTRLGPDPTHGFMDLIHQSGGCGTADPGSVKILQLDVDPEGGALTAFAATVSLDCNAPGEGGQISGELRWHSSVGYVAAKPSDADIDFGDSDVNLDSAAKTYTITSAGTLPVHLGPVALTGAPEGTFRLTADTCSNAALDPGQQCSLSIVAHPGSVGTQFAATLTIPDNTAATTRTLTLEVTGRPSPIGSFYPVGPSRIMDTRTGAGGYSVPLGPGMVDHVQVSGAAGLPTSGIAAAVLNVTATDTTGPSYLTIYPGGTQRPETSNLNFPPGSTIANSVTVQLSPEGTIDIYNSNGNTDVVVDVVGFYGGSDGLLSWDTRNAGSKYYEGAPTRLLDTRDGSLGGPLPGGWWADIVANYNSDADPTANSHVRALAVNITAVDEQGSGWLTSWNGVGNPPNASTLNFGPGRAVPNFAVVPTSACLQAGCYGMPMISVYNGSDAPVDLIVDVVGVFVDSSVEGGMSFTPIAPTRIADTRIGQGAPQALGPNSTTTVSDPGAVNDPAIYAMAMNVTAVLPSTPTYITVWSSGAPPIASTLNPYPGQTVPNSAYTGIDVNGDFHVYNATGSVNLLADVQGYFSTMPLQASPAATAQARGPLPSQKSAPIPTLAVTPGPAVFHGTAAH